MVPVGQDPLGSVNVDDQLRPQRDLNAKRGDRRGLAEDRL